ncbi:MotA/TolQ/ExbB proton channel family protein [Vibrio sp. IRLE0018]|uniref:MotA/TolQ/ExbB proton channel family protein n=1 Tax=Vibrio TaxID=662 RepID=UPI001594C4CC|nr:MULTISPECIES: MotA/TolQ/ExbB proton channel family protein [Vibrio]MCF8777835.1 MotA/TolQ/ExbB proton channel family protein [Vibrio floridensis]NVC64294.1 MotA/TolQ/ExbB proton channel family protein [Vibrio sp. 05-20-BW147]HAS6346993.1 MotA/TolQ/ExbB proton channel family protein [Vibrio vulnificus]
MLSVHSDLLPELLTSSAWWNALYAFMQQGGEVLWWLAGVLLIFWALTLEKIFFVYRVFPTQMLETKAMWSRRQDQRSWFALSQRNAWIDHAHQQLFRNLSFIKVLVAICPMLGLLGTVTGMISVFDVMATQGSSNPKLMASGISLATLPTMAGMVAALVGMFVHARLLKLCQNRELKLEQSLRSQQ